jgi:hypothetical protein
MFRRERPQKGRWRQFRQVGAEFFCGSGVSQRVSADVELIVLAQRVLSRLLGKERYEKEVSLQINTLGDVESRTNYSVVLRKYLEGKRSELSPEGLFVYLFFSCLCLFVCLFRRCTFGQRGVVACAGRATGQRNFAQFSEDNLFSQRTVKRVFYLFFFFHFFDF